MTLTANEVLANRRTWVEFLKTPGILKARGILNEANESRCCLGHGCYALNIKRHQSSMGHWLYGREGNGGYAPTELMDAVGLYNSHAGTHDGTVIASTEEDGTIRSLSNWNDNTNIEPAEIGAYLESVIEGGPSTPFKPLSEYAA